MYQAHQTCALHDAEISLFNREFGEDGFALDCMHQQSLSLRSNLLERCAGGSACDSNRPGFDAGMLERMTLQTLGDGGEAVSGAIRRLHAPRRR